ncbi:MAG: hypothetical protein SFW66_09305, partial [Gammaproteobacteria bacterium]|nr:hypothetical protein [Gammaproteobacteria bacterium]
YKELQKATNLNHTSELSHELSKKAIVKLDNLLIDDKSIPNATKIWNVNNVNAKDLRQIENQLLEFRIDITKYREGEFTDHTSLNHLLKGFLEFIIKTATHAGVIFACYQIAHFLVTTKMSYTTLLAFSTPQSAALIMASVWILNQLRNSMTEVAAQKAESFISRHIRTPLQKIMRKRPIFTSLDAEIQLDISDQQFVLELYESPKEIFPDKEKNLFEKVFSPEILHVANNAMDKRIAHYGPSQNMII